MTIRSIIVGLTTDRALAPVRAAVDLANRFDATVTGFGARFVPIVLLADGDGTAYLREKALNERELRAMEQAFTAAVPDARRAGWRGVNDHPESALATEARCADLVLVGATKEEAVGHIGLGALILAAGRPVLVVADKAEKVLAERVVIAWKDSREARRAVSDALPFLIRAREVVVALIDETGDGVDSASGRDVVTYLHQHGASARVEEAAAWGGENAAGKLRDIARGMDADLIVAGAYGHSRLREWAFGGVTRSLLSDPPTNLLMSS